MSSKYKAGDKFIIEIGHITVDPTYGRKYFVKGFRNIAFNNYGLDCLERYDADGKAKQDKIKVGDEVTGAGDNKGIVTHIREDKMYILWGDGSSGEFPIPPDLFKKTGRHYDIESILEQLKGANDD